MTYLELQIKFDLNPDNRVDVLRNVDTCRHIGIDYLFIDQEDGQCYLFNKDGNLDGIGIVKSIGDYAFFNCKSLTKIKIPSSVETIGYWAFAGCLSLKEVVFEGKTLKQIKAMEYYPWRIEDTSIIKCVQIKNLRFLI